MFDIFKPKTLPIRSPFFLKKSHLVVHSKMKAPYSVTSFFSFHNQQFILSHFTPYAVLKQDRINSNTQAPHLVPKYIACRGGFSPYELPQFMTKKATFRVVFCMNNRSEKVVCSTIFHWLSKQKLTTIPVLIFVYLLLQINKKNKP